jgi:formylglycine-generating enzyme required for sulfatase activity
LAQSEFGRFVDVPAGQFPKGDQPLYPEEQPTLRVHVDAFQLQTHEVTNDQFAAFVEATRFVTDAERGAQSHSSGAGSAVFDPDAQVWRLAPGATWRTPYGPGSSIKGKGGGFPSCTSRTPMLRPMRGGQAAGFQAMWSGSTQFGWD